VKVIRLPLERDAQAANAIFVLDKALLSMAGSIGGLLLLVKGYLDRKAGAGDAIGRLTRS
jgi:hypothetical protein